MIEEYGLGITLLIALGVCIVAYIMAYLLSKPLLKFYWNRTTVKLPSSSEEIIQRLSKVTGESSVVKKLYPQIAVHAGRELLPQGIVLMFVLAVNDYSEQYPPFVGGMIQRFIPMWIDALVDQKSAAKYTKDWLKNVEKRAEKERIANTPPRKEPEGPIEDDNLYSAVIRIADIFFEEVEKRDVDNLISISRRDDGVNPFYSQTDSGLFLEYYYGHPSKIWTPWGYLGFTGSCITSGNAPWEEILDSFLERLGAILFTPEQDESFGVVGPVYALHKVDDMKLPEPRLREKQNYLEYEVVKEAWKNMANRYQPATK